MSGFAIFSGDSGVAQPVATVLGGAGVLCAGVLTFRSAHNTRVSAEKTAAAALTHAQTELQHTRTVAAEEKARHETQFEEQRQQAERALREQASTFERTYQREVIRDLRSRYTICAEQLAHDSAAVRLAGVYALTSLADDWQLQNERVEKQVAIDLLCAYLRTPNTRTPKLIADGLPDTGELEVRKTILLTLHARSTLEISDPKSWKGLEYDITNVDMIGVKLFRANLTNAILFGANLTDANLNRTDLPEAILYGANLTRARLAVANLTRADLSRADLTDANLSDANLIRARLAVANLPGANLSGANLYSADLIRAQLVETNLTDANLTHANLTSAVLTRADLTNTDMTDADLTDADMTDANVIGATFVNVSWTSATIWPAGFTPPDPREER